MRVLITGGTGFIGSQLARRLLKRGEQVRLLSLINSEADRLNARELVARGAELIEGSVADRKLHGRALDGVDLVHHVAATMHEADVPDQVFWETNYQATKDLVEASRLQGARRLVYCSTMGVTGEVRGRLVDETEPHRPRNIYERTKSAAERWVIEEANGNGLTTTAIRPADVYGPRDRRLLKLFRMIQKGTFVYLGSGRGRRHMIYIDDLLDGMLLAGERSEAAGRVFLLAGPAPVTLRELVGLIADGLAVRRPGLRLPYRPVRLVSAVVEAACRPLGVQPPIHPRRVDFYAHDYGFDTSAARKALGFESRTEVREGIRRTIAAYREEGLLA